MHSTSCIPIGKKVFPFGNLPSQLEEFQGRLRYLILFVDSGFFLIEYSHLPRNKPAQCVCMYITLTIVCHQWNQDRRAFAGLGQSLMTRTESEILPVDPRNPPPPPKNQTLVAAGSQKLVGKYPKHSPLLFFIQQPGQHTPRGFSLGGGAGFYYLLAWH